ncbi:hypothetical protein, partial [Streptococcus pneumoniae]|uniref:hypothetical protein n=1 Tax=Streptococcus pneumoniae TaxID=1313 RepID=UPI001E3DF93D
MKKYLDINLNNYVHVYLDAKGKQLILDKYETTEIEMWKSEKYPGMFKFQFWQFMNIFANQSCGSYAPFNLNVIVE